MKEDDYVIGFFGSLEKVKRIDKLILAMCALTKYENIKLLIVGDGSEEDFLRRLVIKYDLENIVFYKRVRHHMMPKVISIINVLVLPSISEGFPGIVLHLL